MNTQLTPDQNAAALMILMLGVLVVVTVVMHYRRKPRERSLRDALRDFAEEYLEGMESPTVGGLQFLVEQHRAGEAGAIDKDPSSFWKPGYRYKVGDVIEFSEEAIQDRIERARESVAAQVERGGIEVTVRGHVWLNAGRDEHWLATHIGDVQYRHTFEGNPIEWLMPGIGAGQESHPRGHTIHFTNPGKVREFHVDPPADPKYPGFKPCEAGIGIDEVNIAKDEAPPIMATKVSWHGVDFTPEIEE